MTAELCDCYPTKREGVSAVIDAVSAAWTEGEPLVWCVDGTLRPAAAVRDTLLPAAANWLALAAVAAGMAGPGTGVLIDVGSTTTDLVPLRGGRPDPAGRSDTERLQTGELVYVGVRRTPLCAVAGSLPFRGRGTDLAAEVFATTGDVFVLLGDLREDADDCDTADDRPATRAFVRDRLARMVCADREGFTEDDALRMARSVRERILARLFESAGRAGLTGEGRPELAVVAGSGEFLARELARRLVTPGGRIIRLSEAWGADASAAGCAVALRRIAEGGHGTDFRR
jgi:probable H4MPT-linked C1 transfer pathway protein